MPEYRILMQNYVQRYQFIKNIFLALYVNNCYFYQLVSHAQ